MGGRSWENDNLKKWWVISWIQYWIAPYPILHNVFKVYVKHFAGGIKSDCLFFAIFKSLYWFLSFAFDKYYLFLVNASKAALNYFRVHITEMIALEVQKTWYCFSAFWSTDQWGGIAPPRPLLVTLYWINYFCFLLLDFWCDFSKKIRSNLKAIWVTVCSFFKAIWNNLIAKIWRLFERIKPRHFFWSSLSNTGQVQKPSWLEDPEIHSKLFTKAQINFIYSMWRLVCSAFHITTSLHNFVMLFYSKLNKK